MIEPVSGVARRNEGLMLAYALLLTTYRDVDGRPAQPTGGPGAKATVLFFLLDGCPIARKYSPEIRRVAADYRARGVQTYLVFSEPKLTKARVQALRQEFSLPFSAVLDKGQSLARRVGVKALPTAAVFTPTGKLAYAGRIDDRFPALGVQRAVRRQDLREALNDVLANRAVRVPRTNSIGCLLPKG